MNKNVVWKSKTKYACAITGNLLPDYIEDLTPGCYGDSKPGRAVFDRQWAAGMRYSATCNIKGMVYGRDFATLKEAKAWIDGNKKG